MYQVLLVDSNHHAKEKLKMLIDWKGIGFILQDHAETLLCTLRLFRENQYSLIIINMTTFNQDGLKVCEYIRKRSRIPILLIGETNDYQFLRKALNLQVSDYLLDPVNPEELVTSLQSLKNGLNGNEFLSRKKSRQVRPSNTSHKSTINIVEKVKAYVEDAINENITLKEISSIFHYNCSYLGQKFKSQGNMTFNEYLLQQRMEKAKHLLHNTNMKIYEIAYEVGYTELDWFYKKFKSYTGVSASEYRKRSTTKLSSR